MARATRNARRQAVRLGLLTALGAACAVIQEPPGGPPDFTPPVIVSITPDSGVVLERLDRAARIQFDEVISEQSGRGLANLVGLSPRPRELDVDWKRTAIEVRPSDGWRRGVVYQLQLLPGVQDLRNNRLDSGRTVVFGVGIAGIPDTRVTGFVLDWEDDRPAARALVEAVLLPDSLVYHVRADSTGAFQLAQLPEGSYVVYGVVDENDNGLRDLRERYDSATVALDSSATFTLWAVTRDTLGPTLSAVTYLDSLTMRLELTRHVHPDLFADLDVGVDMLPDTTPVAVAAVWRPATYDSVRAAAAEAVDTLPPDTVAVEPPAAEPQPPEPDTAAVQRPDSTEAQRLLRTRPTLLNAVFLRMEEPLRREGRYLVRLRATSIAGWPAESRRLLITPAPRDST